MQLERSGDPAAAEISYAEVFRAGWHSGRAELLPLALRRQAALRCRRGAYDDAEDLALLSLEIARCIDQRRELAWAENQLATIFHHRQKWDEARQHYEHALDLARENEDYELVAISCQNLGVVAQMLGDLSTARGLYLESIAAATRSGPTPSAAHVYNNLGLLARDRREWLDAQLFYDRGLEIAQRTGFAVLEALLQANRAEPLIQIDELDQARTALDRAEELARKTGNARALVDVARLRAVIARRQGELDLAERHLMDGLTQAETAHLLLEQAEMLEELGRLHRDKGRKSLAAAAVRHARDVFLEIGARLYAERAEALADDLERAV